MINGDDNQITKITNLGLPFVCFNKYLVFNKGLELLWIILCLMNLKW